jgi:hypothetical protein
MPETTQEDVVNALLANFASQLGSTSKKTSSRSKKPSFESMPESSKPCPKAPAPSAHRMAVQSSADDRLESFIIGESSLRMPDGTDLWHDMAEGRRYTLNEIATVMGVTRERVRQIEQSALKKAFSSFSAMARREGENPIEWFRNMFNEMERNHDGTYEFDAV